MPEVVTLAALHEVEVSALREPGPGIAILECDAPHLALRTRPGQFVMVVAPAGERAATALGVYEAQDERIALMVAVCGPRTRELANLRPGARLTMLGPLGNGFDLDALGKDVVIVAGGVGFASLYLAARALVARGARVRVLYGARTAPALVGLEKLAALGIAVSVATDDGSQGHHGYVTDLIAAHASAATVIAACGPEPMLRSVARESARLGIPAQLSIEETFACGVGACWGCVVPHSASEAGKPLGLIGDQGGVALAPLQGRNERGERFTHVRICREGPVFWAHELRW